MPIRLVLFLLAILAGFLYLVFFNSASAPLTLAPDLTISLPTPMFMLASFILGAVTVMLLYFYDAFADAFGGLRRAAREKRLRRVAQWYETGAERLLIENRRDAEKYFKKALAHNPDHVPSLIALGKMRREDGEVSEAIGLHAKARGLEAGNIAALLELAEDYVAAEQFTNAVSILQETTRLAGRSAPPLIRIRDIFLRVKNHKEAINVQKQVISYSPITRVDRERQLLVALTYEAALEHLAGGRFYDARNGLKTVLRHDDHFIPAYLKLAEAHERIGSPRDAIKTLEKGFKITRSLIILKALEMFLLARDEAQRVIDDYRWAKGLLPDEPMVRLFLAEAYLRNADLASARAEIESVDGATRNMTLYHLIEGKIRHGENNIDQALESLDEAFQREVGSIFHFSCASCQTFSVEYAGRCRSCGEWNTLQPVLF